MPHLFRMSDGRVLRWACGASRSGWLHGGPPVLPERLGAAAGAAAGAAKRARRCSVCVSRGVPDAAAEVCKGRGGAAHCEHFRPHPRASTPSQREAGGGSAFPLPVSSASSLPPPPPPLPPPPRPPRPPPPLPPRTALRPWWTAAPERYQPPLGEVCQFAPDTA